MWFVLLLKKKMEKKALGHASARGSHLWFSDFRGIRPKRDSQTDQEKNSNEAQLQCCQRNDVTREKPFYTKHPPKKNNRKWLRTHRNKNQKKKKLTYLIFPSRTKKVKKESKILESANDCSVTTRCQDQILHTDTVQRSRQPFGFRLQQSTRDC